MDRHGLGRGSKVILEIFDQLQLFSRTQIKYRSEIHVCLNWRLNKLSKMSWEIHCVMQHPSDLNSFFRFHVKNHVATHVIAFKIGSNIFP
jgi:hypothetical protein